MNFSDIQDRIEALVKLGGWSNSYPPPDFAFLANQGLREFTGRTLHNIEDLTISTVLDQATYAANADDPGRDWIDLNDDAIWNGPPNPLSSAWLSKTSRDQLRLNNRLWRTTPSGTPLWWYWAGPQTVGLFPAPNSSAVDVFFEGPRHEPILKALDQIPLVEDEFHEGICLYGAWFHGKLYSRGAERDIAKEYMIEAGQYVARCKGRYASQESTLVQRRVARPLQEYLGLGSMQRPVYWPVRISRESILGSLGWLEPQYDPIHPEHERIRSRRREGTFDL